MKSMANLPDTFLRRKIVDTQKECPKCHSCKIEAFDFSFNPRILICKKCGYEWELPYPKYLERIRKRFSKMMKGNFDL